MGQMGSIALLRLIKCHAAMRQTGPLCRNDPLGPMGLLGTMAPSGSMSPFSPMGPVDST